MAVNMTPDLIDEVKEQVDLVPLLTDYGVELQPYGRYYKGLCPFHSDRRPSLVVYPETGTWKCFGCGAQGDAIDFLRQKEGLSFPDAFRLLADRAGLAVESGPPTVDYTDLAQECQKRFDAEVHHHPEGLVAAFFKRRGISYGVCRQLWVGLDERGWLVLPFFGGWLGESPVIGFAYRQVTEKEFRVQPDFPRARFLYPARVEKTDRPVIVVEGYFDALSLRSKGYEAYALGSTSISKGQLIRLLRSHPGEVVVWLDGDAAGDSGARDVTRKLLTAGLHTSVVQAPGDPDEHDTREVQQLLQARQEGALWLAEPVLVRFEQELFRLQRSVIQEFLPLVSSLTDSAEAAAFRQLVARRLSLDLSCLF